MRRRTMKKVLADDAVDMVLIATRHNLHADMVLAALGAGKHVLVEKPLAINAEELVRIEQFYREHHDAPLLLTGFNRRHSRYLQEITKHTSVRQTPHDRSLYDECGLYPTRSLGAY